MDNRDTNHMDQQKHPDGIEHRPQMSDADDYQVDSDGMEPPPDYSGLNLQFHFNETIQPGSFRENVDIGRIADRTLKQTLKRCTGYRSINFTIFGRTFTASTRKAGPWKAYFK